MFKSNLLRRIFGIKRNEVKYVLRNLPIGERHKTFDSKTVIRMIKQRGTDGQDIHLES
jgi:hypothetical protein